MDTKEIIALISAIIAFVSLLCTLYFSSKARGDAKLAKEDAAKAKTEREQAAVFARQAEATAVGQAETALRQAISATRQAVRNLAVQVASVRDGKRDDELLAADKRRLEPLEFAFHEAVEDNLNAYEDACAKYIDNKIDKTRFKKAYIEEIANLCRERDGIIYDFMHPEGTSKFQAIWKVYREWHVHE